MTAEATKIRIAKLLSDQRGVVVRPNDPEVVRLYRQMVRGYKLTQSGLQTLKHLPVLSHSR